MAVTPSEEVSFDLSDLAPALTAARDAVAEPGGWVNLLPQVAAGEAPPPRNLFAAIFSSRGPTLPLATLSRSDRTTNESILTIGLQHPGGPRALDLLAERGQPLPPGWLKLADHPRRGLVVTAPLDAVEPAVEWLVTAARLLAGPDLPQVWLARIYRAGHRP